MPKSKRRSRKVARVSANLNSDATQSSGCLFPLVLIHWFGVCVYYGFASVILLTVWLIGKFGTEATKQRMANGERVGWDLLIAAFEILIPLLVAWGLVYLLRFYGRAHFEKRRLEFVYVGLAAIIILPLVYSWHSEIMRFLHV